MRTCIYGCTLSAAVVLLVGSASLPGRAQPGPGDDGAVLRLPGSNSAKPAATIQPATASAPGNPRPAFTGANAAEADRILAHLAVDPRYAMNDDIKPTESIGPWMICVHSYVTKDGPELARQMVAELRANNTYRLPAYVFTYGLEERRKEYDRVKAVLEKQQAALKGLDLEVMYMPRTKDGSASPVLSNGLPLGYVLGQSKVAQIPVQCAVLVGGFPTQDAAERALKQIKKLPQPDPNKVKLDIKFYGSDVDPMNPSKLNIKKDSGRAEYVNPFTKAFLCRNPAIKQERAADVAQDGMDIKLLRKLNQDEPYSLLNCKKPITLAIKQFQTFTMVQSRDEQAGILENFGLKTRSGEGIDQAAHDAHQLAELLRKSRLKLDAYVLHTKYTSVVTVGGYDSLQDPGLIAMRNELGSKLREWDRLMFFPQPQPMQVPR